ncbi:MAG: hypothetical protein ABI130_14480 [Leifsonia sp.]
MTQHTTDCVRLNHADLICYGECMNPTEPADATAGGFDVDAAYERQVEWMLDGPGRTLESPGGAQIEARSCRVCGCTDADCSGCVERTGRARHWSLSAPRLCSACEDNMTVFDIIDRLVDEGNDVVSHQVMITWLLKFADDLGHAGAAAIRADQDTVTLEPQTAMYFAEILTTALGRLLPIESTTGPAQIVAADAWAAACPTCPSWKTPALRDSAAEATRDRDHHNRTVHSTPGHHE